MKRGPATRYTADGLGFQDGSTVSADVIVWATGFETNIRDNIRSLFGDDAADQIDEYFGIDDEGEIRGAWRFQRKYYISPFVPC